VARDRGRSWRDDVFKGRGTLLALPAVSLALLGKPSSQSIALGLPIAFAGEALRCWAVGYSGATTRSDRVEAPQLTTAGPYAYVRNPLYVGNFLTALGFGTMLAVYAAIIPLEEAYLRQTFGDDFDGYLARVPPIVPRLSPARPERGTYDAGVIVKAETRTFVTFGAMLGALALKALRAG
jgi:hypothetical protein